MAKLRVAENILLKGMIAAPQSVYLQVLPCRPSLVLQRRLPLPASAAALDSGVAWASRAKAGKAIDSFRRHWYHQHLQDQQPSDLPGGPALRLSSAVQRRIFLAVAAGPAT